MKKKIGKIKFLLLFFVLLFLCTACSAPKNFEKTFIIATDIGYAPFEFKDPNGKNVGIDIEILEEISKNQKFKYELKVIPFNSAIAGLESGQIDAVIAAIIITDERKIKYNFSKPYFKTTVSVGIKKDENRIKTFEDLRNKKVALKTGSQAAVLAESIKQKYGFFVNYFDETSMMYDEIITGNSIACFEDKPVLEYAIDQGSKLKVAFDTNSEAYYGFAVLKDKNKELLRMFDEELNNIKQSGAYMKIISKYVKDFGENNYEYDQGYK